MTNIGGDPILNISKEYFLNDPIFTLEDLDNDPIIGSSGDKKISPIESKGIPPRSKEVGVGDIRDVRQDDIVLNVPRNHKYDTEGNLILRRFFKNLKTNNFDFIHRMKNSTSIEQKHDLIIWVLNFQLEISGSKVFWHDKAGLKEANQSTIKSYLYNKFFQGM